MRKAPPGIHAIPSLARAAVGPPMLGPSRSSAAAVNGRAAGRGLHISSASGDVARDPVRVLDLVFIRKEDDGSIDIDELSDAPEGAVGDLLAHEAGLAMLLAEEDIVSVAEALEPGSIAA